MRLSSYSPLLLYDTLNIFFHIKQRHPSRVAEIMEFIKELFKNRKKDYPRQIFIFKDHGEMTKDEVGTLQSGLEEGMFIGICMVDPSLVDPKSHITKAQDDYMLMILCGLFKGYVVSNDRFLDFSGKNKIPKFNFVFVSKAKSVFVTIDPKKIDIDLSNLRVLKIAQIVKI